MEFAVTSSSWLADGVVPLMMIRVRKLDEEGLVRWNDAEVPEG